MVVRDEASNSPAFRPTREERQLARVLAVGFGALFLLIGLLQAIASS
jgi:hypothetical protein